MHGDASANHKVFFFFFFFHWSIQKHRKRERERERESICAPGAPVEEWWWSARDLKLHLSINSVNTKPLVSRISSLLWFASASLLALISQNTGLTVISSPSHHTHTYNILIGNIDERFPPSSLFWLFWTLTSNYPSLYSRPLLLTSVFTLSRQSMWSK